MTGPPFTSRILRFLSCTFFTEICSSVSLSCLHKNILQDTIPRYSRHLQMNKPISYGHEVFRKLIHLSSLWMVASIGYFPKWFNISLFAALLFIMLVVEYGNNKRWPLFTMTYGALFNRILRESETRETFRPSGAPYLIAAVLFKKQLCAIRLWAFSPRVIYKSS